MYQEKSESSQEADDKPLRGMCRTLPSYFSTVFGFWELKG